MVSRGSLKKVLAVTLCPTHRVVATASSDIMKFMPMRLSEQRIFTRRHVYEDRQLAWFSEKTQPTKDEVENTDDTFVAENKQTTVSDAASLDAATKKVEELEVTVKDLTDKMLRSLAEQDNIRRIAKRDVDDARQFSIKSFAKSMLDVADNLDRALKAVPDAMQKDKEAHPVLATLYEGIEMTEKGLLKTFEMNGVVKFGTIGEIFDPNVHEALFEYTDSSLKPGTVGQIIKPGYMLNKRVLRPAEVGVIKKE